MPTFFELARELRDLNCDQYMLDSINERGNEGSSIITTAALLPTNNLQLTIEAAKVRNISNACVQSVTAIIQLADAVLHSLTEDVISAAIPFVHEARVLALVWRKITHEEASKACQEVMDMKQRQQSQLGREHMRLVRIMSDPNAILEKAEHGLGD